MFIQFKNESKFLVVPLRKKACADIYRLQGVPTCRDGGLHFIQSCEVGLEITRDADVPKFRRSIHNNLKHTSSDE